jgi:hypothetical protein
MLAIQAVVDMILAGRRHISAYESMLVAVSGIDGSAFGVSTSSCSRAFTWNRF